MNASRYLSYLDLMCCGFGGAVLMFLIVASSRPEQRPTDQILVVRCRTDWDRAGTRMSGVGASGGNGIAANGQRGNRTQPPPRAEVGVEYRRAGELVWRRGKLGDGTAGSSIFVAPSGDGSGSETVLVWRQPTRGRWEFRPYLIDFPSARVRGSNQPGPTDDKESISVPVTLEALGRRLRIEGDPSSQLELPGDTGATLKVDLF